MICPNCAYRLDIEEIAKEHGYVKLPTKAELIQKAAVVVLNGTGCSYREANEVA